MDLTFREDALESDRSSQVFIINSQKEEDEKTQDLNGSSFDPLKYNNTNPNSRQNSAKGDRKAESIGNMLIMETIADSTHSAKGST